MAMATRSSEDIKKDVVDQLYWDGRVNVARVEVKVVEGTVRLDGTVPTYSARRAAEEDAWEVPGVKCVENGLAVAYPDDLAVRPVRTRAGTENIVNRCPGAYRAAQRGIHDDDYRREKLRYLIGDHARVAPRPPGANGPGR